MVVITIIGNHVYGASINPIGVAVHNINEH